MQKIIRPLDDLNLLDASITETYENKMAILTIISDDGDYQTGKKLKQYSEQYKIPITVAGTVISILLHKRFWKNAVNEHLFECINYSYNHPRMVEEETWISKDRKRLTHEIVHSKKYFENLFHREQIAFVTPYNKMCELGYEIMSENNIYAVAQGFRGFNCLNPKNGKGIGQWLNLYRMGIKDTNADTRNRWIDSLIKEKKWLIEMWHNVSKDTSQGYQTISPKEAEEHLQLISEHKDKI